jgi:chloramphenicol-sensitive protein RarD
MSAVLIAVNWYVFILAVSTERVIETSLGYYMTPLANVALGFVFLRERLRPLQLAAIGLAALGVGMLAAQAGQFPWIAVSLAVSFSFYGLLRKIVGVDSLYGLLFETAALTPAAIGLIIWQAMAPAAGQLAIPGLTTLGLLALTGPITSGPLLLFAAAARRLKMATLGILQFLAPTIQFSIAVLVFHEPFTAVHGRSFACIWLAIAVYSLDALRMSVRGPSRAIEPPAAPVECGATGGR